ncbi:MAG: sodium:solute symporter [Candidatus Sumerlaeaceae bacterium]|nr:sodium:solute symporter [Candidatus Sumerlaeaceae bacterium]
MSNTSGLALLIDGLLIVFYFVGIIFIGLYVGRKEGSLHEFALGGRRIPWWAVMASIIAAETSAATFLGVPGEGYNNKSLAYVQLVMGLILGRIFVGYFFLKPYYDYKVYTVYDYLGIRFGNKSKNYISGLFLIMRTLASGTRLFVPSLVMVLAYQMFTQGSGGGGVKFSQTAVSSVTPYIIAIIALTILTCIYTALGGIKAVIWTDVIQATLMFTGAIVAIVTLLYHIGGDSMNLANGLGALTAAVPQMTRVEGYFLTGFEPETVNKWMEAGKVTSMTAWEYFKLVMASDYTLFSALIGATLGNMAAFGTDQDMVQRMLTAETYQKSRRSLITAALMDVPIAAAFTFIGILLFVYYQQSPTFKPSANSDVFGSYILNVMPWGIRGLVLAGVFATAMGSLSAALNALATSATNDWYIPYVARHKGQEHHVFAARVFTTVFAVLMIIIACLFARAKVYNPDVRIIPVVLGIAGFILGPMLGVFLIGMFTKSRGSDLGNMVAITVGLIVTMFFGRLHISLLDTIQPGSELVKSLTAWQDAHVMKISFAWFALVGAVAVFLVGVLFPTPRTRLAEAERRMVEAQTGEDKPVYLRSDTPDNVR